MRTYRYIYECTYIVCMHTQALTPKHASKFEMYANNYCMHYICIFINLFFDIQYLLCVHTYLWM